MQADVLTALFNYAGMRRQDVTIHKAIRWAFEKQGLYQPVGTAWPNNQPGAPPDVDVYIDDGRKGEYQFVENWQTVPHALWLTDTPNGPHHTSPQVGHTYFVHVRVSNRGLNSAVNSSLEIYEAAGASADS